MQEKRKLPVNEHSQLDIGSSWEASAKESSDSVPGLLKPLTTPPPSPPNNINKFKKKIKIHVLLAVSCTNLPKQRQIISSSSLLHTKIKNKNIKKYIIFCKNSLAPCGLVGNRRLSGQHEEHPPVVPRMPSTAAHTAHPHHSHQNQPLQKKKKKNNNNNVNQNKQTSNSTKEKNKGFSILSKKRGECTLL